METPKDVTDAIVVTPFPKKSMDRDTFGAIQAKASLDTSRIQADIADLQAELAHINYQVNVAAFEFMQGQAQTAPEA